MVDGSPLCMDVQAEWAHVFLRQNHLPLSPCQLGDEDNHNTGLLTNRRANWNILNLEGHRAALFTSVAALENERPETAHAQIGLFRVDRKYGAFPQGRVQPTQLCKKSLRMTKHSASIDLTAYHRACSLRQADQRLSGCPA